MLNDKQLEALDVVKNGENLFLTGSAGTGKSFTLKAIINYLNQNRIPHGVTALTGCAAVLINGQTIHSFLSLGISRNIEDIYKNICKFKPALLKLQFLKTLIIDEISMMDDELFSIINRLLMRIKMNELFFGGVQLILVGDFHQLPPINGDFCFTSHLWEGLQLKPVILTELIRQKDDNQLQMILEEIRNGKISDETFEILEGLKNTTFEDKEVKPTRLFPVNTNVDKINNREFARLLKINSGEKVEYKAYSSKGKDNIDDYAVTLTKGAQVMVIRNISIEDRLFNGTRGVVVDLMEKSVVIKDIYNNTHIIEYYTDINENDIKKNISFMPLKLAYAISIHKSQGASIDFLEIDIGDDIFISGQLYTALSRATNISNIKINNISKSSFIQNEKVKKFYESIKK